MQYELGYIYATWVGLGQVLSCLISGHLWFQFVRVQIWSGFGLFDLGSSQILYRSGSNWVEFQIAWSRVIRVRIGSCFRLSDLGSSRISDRSGSGRVRFGLVCLSKIFRSNRVRVHTGRTGFSGRVEFCHLYLYVWIFCKINWSWVNFFFYNHSFLKVVIHVVLNNLFKLSICKIIFEFYNLSYLNNVYGLECKMN
jgi:hypothetical protein